ncbi:uncharacterized protein BX663DRAFT_553847 [Cokeromyces recurvatus]|uniref:uncharacterized protein n=1 Tax=Cokeromyces recurvatus TaxID=90255 RepID=UPI0022200C02|nr:uncharacterized protein BX663DRAFT_553847 [Cokeromyces recurvatus]KAI7900537.1 hypothetical protein BX663DRAFT_553847 [Cokeromyces recurvatus]
MKRTVAAFLGKKKKQVSFIQDSSEQVDNTVEAPIDCRSNEKIDDYMLAAPIVELNSSFKRKFQLENGIVTTDEVSKEQEKFRCAKRRKNYTKKYTHNCLHLYFDMGLTIREIHYITGMCIGSIQLRVKKQRSKYPERHRNVKMTNEMIESLRQLCIQNSKDQ